MGKYNKGASTNLYYIVSDCLFSGIAFLIAAIISGMFGKVITEGYWGMIISFLVIYILSGKDSRLYNITTFFYPDRFFKGVTLSFLIASIVTSSLLFLGGKFKLNLNFYIIFLVLCYLFLLFSSFFMHFVLQKYIISKQRTLLIGRPARYEKFVRFLSQSNIDVDIVGHVSFDENETEGYLGSINDLENIIHDNSIDQIYVMTHQYGKTIDVQPYIDLCVEMGVTVRIVMNSYRAGSSLSYVSSVGTYPIITYHTVFLTKSYRAIKRIIDIIGSLFGIIVFSPFMLLAAVAIKLDSKGPILFKQQRVGMNGRCFNIYKFRSMCIDAEEKKKDLLEQNEMEGGYMFKIKDDPRITKVGKFIRKTSIDELPQFFNVFFGDMSLVGTRPPTLDEVKMYKTNHWRRISIKPGITGMWQVNGRSTVTDFDEIVKLDISYIDQWGVLSDFKIMFQTVWQVLRHKGAS